MKSDSGSWSRKRSRTRDKFIRFHTQHLEDQGSRIILKIEDEDITAGDKLLIEKAKLFIRASSHIALTGANGSGKTTLFNHLYQQYRDSGLPIVFPSAAGIVEH